MKIIFRMLMVIGAVLILSGCNSSSTPFNQNRIEISKSQRAGVGNTFSSPAVEAVVPSVRVALLLPLSGAHQDLGKSLLDAAQLALFEHNESALTLLPIDSGDSTKMARKAAEEAMREKAALILGPVFSPATREVLSVTHGAPVVVSFSNDNALAGTGAFVLGVSPQDSITRMVRFGMSRNIRDYAALLPEENFGKEVEQQLHVLVQENMPASVVGVHYYSPKSLQTGGAETAIVQLSKEISTASGAAVKAVLIPEGGERLKAITPRLGLIKSASPSVQWMGSAQWDPTDLPQNSLLDGAWFAAPAPEKLVAFETRFYQRFGYRPHRLAGLAYDAVSLAVLLVRERGMEPIFPEHLTKPQGFAGANGIFRFKSNGLNERAMAILRVNGKSFSVVEAAPESF